MPTVLGILGYDRPYVGFGQDALHTPASEKFAVNYIHASGIYQFLKGDYLIQFDGEKVIHAYRFRTERTDEGRCERQHAAGSAERNGNPS